MPLHLSRCKGGTQEDAEAKWLFAEGPLLLDEAKLFSLFVKMALQDTEDSFNKRWLVILIKWFSKFRIAPQICVEGFILNSIAGAFPETQWSK